MKRDPRCPCCGGVLQQVDEGRREVPVWSPAHNDVVAQAQARPFVACTACEFVYDGQQHR